MNTVSAKKRVVIDGTSYPARDILSCLMKELNVRNFSDAFVAAAKRDVYPVSPSKARTDYRQFMKPNGKLPEYVRAQCAPIFASAS